MPAKGEICVCVSSACADAAARWLRGTFLPHLSVKPDTILTAGYNAEACRYLEELALLLAKAAARKRSSCHSFTVNIERRLVESFTSNVSKRHFPPANARGWHLPPAVAPLLEAMNAAKQARRGRPRLTSADVAVRLTGKSRNQCALNPKRWPARLKRREKISAAYDKWFDSVRECGETILTTTLPLPKI